MSNTRKLICIVDDDPLVRSALGRLLKAHGYATLSFSSGRECLDGPEIDQAAVALIDVVMPGMNGFELYTLLQSSGRNIPTIFISAEAHKNYDLIAESVGAAGFLSKPCDEAELLDVIEHALAA